MHWHCPPFSTSCRATDSLRTAVQAFLRDGLPARVPAPAARAHPAVVCQGAVRCGAMETWDVGLAASSAFTALLMQL